MGEAVLELQGLVAGYGDTTVLQGISLSVPKGQRLAVIGRNGVGKTTLLASIMGLTRQHGGTIRYKGQDLKSLPPHRRSALGLGLVPQTRDIFPSLSVEENLIIGGQLGRKGPWSLQRVYDLFPILKERRHQQSTSLSGGQQQMVAIGRALMANPELVLMDEISLGLAPVIIRQIYEALPGIVGEGLTAVIVEQDIAKALSVSQRVYCLQEGRVSLEGQSQTVPREEITRAYFGV